LGEVTIGKGEERHESQKLIYAAKKVVLGVAYHLTLVRTLHVELGKMVPVPVLLPSVLSYLSLSFLLCEIENTYSNKLKESTF
jgi:hypothetical protein